MKLHVGVDSGANLLHSMTTIAVNANDGRVLGQLLHAIETRSMAIRGIEIKGS